jgi:glycosyltransferase involved in cell wall biosynthesis
MSGEPAIPRHDPPLSGVAPPGRPVVLHVVGGLDFKGGICSVVDALASSPDAAYTHQVWMHRDFVPPDKPYAFVCEGRDKHLHPSILRDAAAALLEAVALWRHLRRKPLVILHAHSRVGILSACLLRARTRIPTVVHFHYLAKTIGLYRLLCRLARPRPVFNSEKTCRHYGFEPATSIIVTPSIPWASSPPATHPRPRLVSAGDFVPVKRTHLTIQTCLALAGEGLEMDCVLFGSRAIPVDVAYERGLRRLSRESRHVHLEPWCRQWTDQLGADDIFVHLVPNEAFGIAMLEAFARGLKLVICEGSVLDDLPEPQRSLGIFRVRDLSVESAVDQVRRALASTAGGADLWRLRKEVSGRFDATQGALTLQTLYGELSRER